jgi:hypothetical protein
MVGLARQYFLARRERQYVVKEINRSARYAL